MEMARRQLCKGSLGSLPGKAVDSSGELEVSIFLGPGPELWDQVWNVQGIDVFVDLGICSTGSTQEASETGPLDQPHNYVLKDEDAGNPVTTKCPSFPGDQHRIQEGSITAAERPVPAVEQHRIQEGNPRVSTSAALPVKKQKIYKLSSNDKEMQDQQQSWPQDIPVNLGSTQRNSTLDYNRRGADTGSPSSSTSSAISPTTSRSGKSRLGFKKMAALREEFWNKEEMRWESLELLQGVKGGDDQLRSCDMDSSACFAREMEESLTSILAQGLQVPSSVTHAAQIEEQMQVSDSRIPEMDRSVYNAVELGGQSKRGEEDSAANLAEGIVPVSSELTLTQVASLAAQVDEDHLRRPEVGSRDILRSPILALEERTESLNRRPRLVSEEEVLLQSNGNLPCAGGRGRDQMTRLAADSAMTVAEDVETLSSAMNLFQELGIPSPKRIPQINEARLEEPNDAEIMMSPVQAGELQRQKDGQNCVSEDLQDVRKQNCVDLEFAEGRGKSPVDLNPADLRPYSSGGDAEALDCEEIPAWEFGAQDRLEIPAREFEESGGLVRGNSGHEEWGDECYCSDGWSEDMGPYTCCENRSCSPELEDYSWPFDDRDKATEGENVEPGLLNIDHGTMANDGLPNIHMTIADHSSPPSRPSLDGFCKNGLDCKNISSQVSQIPSLGAGTEIGFDPIIQSPTPEMEMSEAHEVSYGKNNFAVSQGAFPEIESFDATEISAAWGLLEMVSLCEDLQEGQQVGLQELDGNSLEVPSGTGTEEKAFRAPRKLKKSRNSLQRSSEYTMDEPCLDCQNEDPWILGMRRVKPKKWVDSCAMNSMSINVEI